MPSLREVSENDFFVNLFLVPLNTVNSLTAETAQAAFDLIEYSGNGIQNEGIALYRVVGTHKDHLNCKSTVLMATKLKTSAVDIKCNDEDVVLLKVPHNDSIPYVEITYGNSLLNELELFGSRRHLTIQNNSGMDLHFEWFRDVHTDHAWDFIQNNKHETRKSRKVDVSAYFPVKVYKNDAGSVGSYIGSFTAEVYGHDRVAIVNLTVDGKPALRAISLVETPLKILATWFL
ncbi:hypothetical protein QUF95_08900 [Paenibacillus silvae]|uniref:hypothetical protein n=1 Tax=Paenibacillus silvae TaxID=1325358 RepID=UPI0025A2F0F3|nr:hypothetical protein [Paenibacillus silvae]MDM5277499.1 hypothetical protein [Paenibacillus silvae]